MASFIFVSAGAKGGSPPPPGAAIVILAIAMIELDGVMILIGLVASAAAMVIASLGLARAILTAERLRRARRVGLGAFVGALLGRED